MGTIHDCRDALTCSSCTYAERLTKQGDMPSMTLRCSLSEEYVLIFEICDNYKEE